MCNPKGCAATGSGNVHREEVPHVLSRMLPGAPLHVGRDALATTVEAGTAHCAARRAPHPPRLVTLRFRPSEHVAMCRVLVSTPAIEAILPTKSTCSSSAVDRPAPRRRTGSRRRARRRGRREEVTSRARRPAATGSPAAPSTSSRTWVSSRHRRVAPSLRRSARGRARHHARAEVARASRVPVVRVRRAPARPRRTGRRQRGRRRRLLRQGTRRSTPLLRNGLVAGAVVRGKDGEHVGDPWLATSWSPTAPTPGSVARSAPPATVSGRRAWPSAATARARCTPSRGSRRRSTCTTATATRLPGYGWIFPVGDGTINIGVGLLSTFRDFKSVNTTHLTRRLRRDRARALGHLARRRRAARRPAAASRWAARSTRRRAHVPGDRRRGRHRQPVQR